MVDKLIDMLGRIVVEIDLGDSPAAMSEIAGFTDFFNQFLRENKDFIFAHEILDLNELMGQMLLFMEQKNMSALKEVITQSLLKLLEHWDFNNCRLN